MDIVKLSKEMASKMFRVIKSNPGRIFCRGIFIPCSEMIEEDVKRIFDEEKIDCAFSLAAFDGDVMKGFAGAVKNDDYLKIVLLECERDAEFAETAGALIKGLFSLANDAGLAELRVEPQQPLSSAFNLRDDQMIETLFTYGFYNDLTIAAEMRINLSDWSYPDRMIERKKKLAKEDIKFRPMREDDLDEMHTLHGEGHAWMKLIKDVMDVDTSKIVVATKGARIIAYSTFFARTIFSELPEYGPVMVDPDYRRLGLSSVLMAESLLQIKDIGKADEVQLSCYPNKFPVYPRQGFHFTHKYLFHATAKIA